MIIYNKIQTFKCDEEMYKFLQILPKKSNFIRDAIFEKMQKEKLIPKKDNRKKATLQDLQRSLNEVFKI